MISNKAMDPEIKQLWLQALRSGTFPQGKHYLDKSDSYCCLGVLCTIAESKNVVVREHYGDDEAFYRNPVNHSDQSSQILPGVVMHWAGLGNEFAEVTISEEDFYSLGLSYTSLSEVATVIPDHDAGTSTIRIALTSMNDFGGSFEQIADIIEKYL